MPRAEIRIVAGDLRRRKIECEVRADLRPTPQMVREALFSILGNAVPDRPFFDLFAGTGVIGLEAISRGATSATFVERDFKLAGAITHHLDRFGVAARGRVWRADVYRWAERWIAPAEPVNVFLSPPFPDLTRPDDPLLAVLARLQRVVAVDSVLVVQLEDGFDPAALPDAAAWDWRKYGRNVLAFWKPSPTDENRDDPESRDHVDERPDVSL